MQKYNNWNINRLKVFIFGKKTKKILKIVKNDDKNYQWSP